MITATTLEDAAKIASLDDVFDLEEAYLDWVKTEKRDDRRGVFHPSAVGGCARRNVYEYIGTPRVFQDTAKDMEVFRLGHAIHDIVQTILGDLERVLTPKGIKYSFRAEVPYDRQMDLLYLDFGIGGTTDGILELHSEKEGWSQRAILEVKSIKDKNFNGLREPKYEHQMQANLYAYRFDCPIIYYWYYNKDSSDRKVFKRKADDAVLNDAMSRFAVQRAHADAGTLPEREESFFICPRCEYGHVCKPQALSHIQDKQRLANVQRKGFGRQ